MRHFSRFRVSLLSLLLLTAVAAVALASWRRSATRQAALVEGVLANGGNVIFAWQIDKSTRKFKKNATPPYPTWLVERIGQHYFHPVFLAQVDLSSVQSADLSFLRYGDSLSELLLIHGDTNDRMDSANLPNLRRLNVFVEGSYDVSQLTRFDCLETVSIDAGKVEGIPALRYLPRLRTLYLNTNACDAPEQFVHLIQLESLIITTLDPSQPPALTAEQLLRFAKCSPIASLLPTILLNRHWVTEPLVTVYRSAEKNSTYIFPTEHCNAAW